MYTGHVAIALAARAVRSDPPLWVLVLASQACDWVEFFTYPFTPPRQTELYSHGFPFVLIAAGAAAVAVWSWRRSTPAAATVLLLYLSHPLVDYVTGFKLLWLGGPPVGLLMIYRPVADFVTQAAMCVLGFAIYWRSLPEARRRQLSAAAPLVLLLALQGVSDLRLEWVKRRREHRAAALCTPTPPARGAASAQLSSPPRYAASTLTRRG